MAVINGQEIYFGIVLEGAETGGATGYGAQDLFGTTESVCGAAEPAPTENTTE